MAVSDEYREWVIEQLRGAGTVTGRRMFGGYCLYLDGAVFALIADDTLYFKVDDATRPDFEAAGCGPFRPFGADGGAMQYYDVPAAILENPSRLADWASRAAEVSRRAARKKKGRHGPPQS